MKYYITKEKESNIIWGLGTSKSMSLNDARKNLENYISYQDINYHTDLETLLCSKKLFNSVTENGWNRQKYIVVDGFAGYKSDFKITK